MKSRWFLTFTVAACLCAQEILTSETILKLVKAGVGDDVIVGMVNQQFGRYVLSADAIITLKTAGVSDRVISAMIVRSGGGPVTPTSNTVTASIAPSTPPQPTTNNQPAHPDDEKTRVYVSDSQSWEMRGGWAAGGHRNADGTGSWGGAGIERGGARPQTAEIIKTFNQRCPGVTITNNVAKADFAVILDHEGGKGLARRRNKIVVFNRDGDDIFSDSTRAVGSSVKDACQAILDHAPSHQFSTAVQQPSAEIAANAFGPPPVAPLPFVIPTNTAAQSQPVTQPQDTRIVSLAAPQAVAVSQPSQPAVPAPAQPAAPPSIAVPQPIKPAVTQANVPPAAPIQPTQPAQAEPKPEPDAKLELTLTSDPAGAAVEINGVSVGPTPLTVALAPGTACAIAVKKDGFVAWKMNYPTSASGKYNLNANLTKEVFH